MNFLFDSPWPGLTIWALLFAGDYALTLTCARLRRRPGAEKLRVEGSFELTPYFQKDIDSLRTISPRFVLVLLLNLTLLTLIWFLGRETGPQLYEFCLGGLILLQLTIHMRHLQNLITYRAMATNEVTGCIEYSRGLILRISAYQVFAFAGLYLILFAITERWFLLGGTVSCASVGVKHLRLSRKTTSPATTPQLDSVSS